MAACLLVIAAFLLWQNREKLSAWIKKAGDPQKDPPVTDTEPSDTETEPGETTEAPIPVHHYTAEEDSAFLPAEGEFECKKTVITDPDYRIYSAYPVSRSETFNTYCADRLDELCVPLRSPDTAREGGETAVTIDCDFFETENVFSCVFETFTHGKTETADVCVLIYDITNNCPYAPLDVYDHETDYMTVLAKLMREGYERAYAMDEREPDGALLDTLCQPDPACFVNIAMDLNCLYFYHAEESTGKILRSSVYRVAMQEYETEFRRQKQQQEQQQEEPKPPKEKIPDVDYSKAVPQSAAVGSDYFDDALFIGNSLTVGFSKISKLNAQYLATVGMSVSQFFTKASFPDKDGKNVPATEAIAAMKFDKVYLMFGINELGWGSITAFINYYSQIIDRCLEVNPNAVIYVQSILPINEDKWAHSRDYNACVNNVAAAKFNQLIINMCVEKGVNFVNVGEALKDETGNLIADATTDGIHINSGYIGTWVDYLKTHTVKS